MLHPIAWNMLAFQKVLTRQSTFQDLRFVPPFVFPKLETTTSILSYKQLMTKKKLEFLSSSHHMNRKCQIQKIVHITRHQLCLRRFNTLCLGKQFCRMKIYSTNLTRLKFFNKSIKLRINSFIVTALHTINL